MAGVKESVSLVVVNVKPEKIQWNISEAHYRAFKLGFHRFGDIIVVWHQRFCPCRHHTAFIDAVTQQWDTPQFQWSRYINSDNLGRRSR